MIETLTNFNELDTHVKDSDLSYKEAVIDYYRFLGEKHGFTVRKDSSVIRYGVNLGKMDLIWLEPNISFTIEFGNLEEVLKHLWRVMEFSPNLAVLLLSSKSGCKATDVVRLMANSSVFKKIDMRFLVLDLTEREVLYRKTD
jgi:hypothetical protein